MDFVGDVVELAANYVQHEQIKIPTIKCTLSSPMTTQIINSIKH